MKTEITLRRIKYEYIDSLKGLSMIFIVLYHLYAIEKYNIPESLKNIINQGPRGVQMFFIISALTLCMSLSRKMNEEKHFWFTYLLRRFFRIAPVFYFVTILNYLFFHINPADYLPAKIPISSGLILSSITFINGFSPNWIGTSVPGGWIITVTVMFYILLPFIFKKVNNLISTFKLLVLSLIIWNIVTFIILKYTSFNTNIIMQFYASAFIITQLPIFICGIGLFFIIRDNNIHKIKLNSNILLITSIVVYLALERAIYILPIHFLPSVALTGLIYSQHINPSRLIVNKFTAYIGKISYSIFLTHFIIILYINRLFYFKVSISPILDMLVHFVLLMGISVLVSTIVHYFIEMPSINLGEKIGKFYS